MVASPSGKAEACKASIPQFESGCHLSILKIMLYIVSTPIGNLSDMTIRGIETLKSSDLILCEDTRVSKILLTAYDIQKPLLSYHSFNESQRLESIIEKLTQGQNIALISDAGTPLFQDPGFILVKECQSKNIPYTTIPGASSILSALILSGFEVNAFQFLGFLPKKISDLKNSLKNACHYNGLTVFFESPKRTEETLKILNEINPCIELAIIREITKKFETVHKGTASSLLEAFSHSPPRGEIVFVIKGCYEEKIQDFTQFAQTLIQEGLSKKSAVLLSSTLGYVNKDLIYKSEL